MPGKWTCHLESVLTPARHNIQTQHRWSSTHIPHRTLRGEDLGPVSKEAHATVRLRKDGTHKALPLPPLLDTVILEQRSQWEQPKDEPCTANFTPFQKKLWENPFASALASPLRQCRATLISLPDALLTTLHPRLHTSTGDLWFLPVSMTTDKRRLGPPYRFVNRKVQASQLGKKKAWEKAINSRLASQLGSGNREKLVWREDMSGFILEMMRKRVVQKLSWNFGYRGRLMPVASPRTEDIEDVDDLSCILLFASLRTRADDVQDRSIAIGVELEKWSSYFSKNLAEKLDPHASLEVTHTPPPWYNGPLVARLQPRLQYPELEFKTTSWRGRRVAVYSLTDLLGTDMAQEMIQGSKYVSEKCVAIKRARHNVSVEVLLMRLQAYIAKPGP